MRQGNSAEKKGKIVCEVERSDGGLLMKNRGETMDSHSALDTLCH